MTAHTLYLPDQVICTGTNPGRHEALLVSAGVVHGVGSPEHLRGTSDSNCVEVALPGCSLVPGFVDAHVHLAFDGGPDAVARSAVSEPDDVLECIARNAIALLQSGVTTARDLGSPGLLMTRLDQVVPRLGGVPPNVVYSHAPVTTVGGHLACMGGAVRDLAEAHQLIDRQIAAGATWVKVMVNGGFTTSTSTPWDEQFGPEVLASVVHHARTLGARSAAHVHTSSGIRHALAAGFDSLEHCTWLRQDGNFDVDLDLARRIADSGVTVCPTVGANTRVSTAWHRRRDAIALMRESGVRIVAGTDAGIPSTPHREYAAGLQALVQLPLTPEEVLDAATAHAARALGFTDRGTLSVGERADFVVLRGNPLRDPGEFAAIDGVYLAGTAVPSVAAAAAPNPAPIRDR